ncbi:DUF1349 domain-containing protein [Cytophagaceae bacterium DM2B3-1]|uniref:DUF1349 domain-containing protein n=1 Tax=Xanthocytophaga flava TaxID=3048013 RepID=A0ABT7CXQ2_9BACT|nr:DUF1349 domain-containing protein [Xanthocytophaga flavus]MDJ1498544.1 DUF1349 domain-containing protein [Xanthocytophaga flavus]
MTIQESLASYHWMNEPAVWHFQDDGFFLAPDAGSDFWQRTHYGFRNDNAHFYYTETERDFELYTQVRLTPKHRFDQAGLCIRIDEDNWIKTSCEYETPEFSHLGVVVTNLGYSDWSTQRVAAGIQEIEYKIIRKGQNIEVYACYQGSAFEQIRIAYLHKAEAIVKAGIYACSPTAGGGSALFTKYSLTQ